MNSNEGFLVCLHSLESVESGLWLWDGVVMAKRDVWIQIGRKVVSADTIKKLDHSDRNYLYVKVTGERDPLKIGARAVWSKSEYTDGQAAHYAHSTTPEVIARGLLEAVSACAADGGGWLLSFEDNHARTEASWVRSELGREGLPPQRREFTAAPLVVDQGDDVDEGPDDERGELIGDASGIYWSRTGEPYDARREAEKW
ncbi:hypothetical protein ACIBL6_47515 [Streptomyces sp. NPDC050400]|uniref:hypothetical protein n=1 Tax=Streptomyces sp. NPDC050400 TaxID=3365610 RepID=UPI0037B3293D